MRLFCWIFILSVAIVSPMFLDLYPFSVFPMFSDNAAEYVVVEVKDAHGNQLKSSHYGLDKPLLANRDQRYGHQLGPCYFDDHEKIEIEKVKYFLATNFSDQEYPILVRYWKRGFDQSTKTIQNLTSPEEFWIDEVAIGLPRIEAQPSGGGFRAGGFKADDLHQSALKQSDERIR